MRGYTGTAVILQKMLLTSWFGIIILGHVGKDHMNDISCSNKHILGIKYVPSTVFFITELALLDKRHIIRCDACS